MATILIVDDSAMSRRMMRRILSEAGHEVIEATDGLSALERYALERPDLVMLDMNMHGMHGLEVLEQLRLLDPAARVIVATADIQRSTRELTDAAGGSGFVAKPFEAGQVLAAISTVLGGER